MEYLLLFFFAGGFALMVYNTYQRRQRAAYDDEVDAPAVNVVTITEPTQPAAATSSTQLPPFETWWRSTVKDVVHLMIVGETGSGKSTAATALLVCRAQIDRVLILDPHARPGDWGGLPAIGRGRNYPAINEAFVALEQEMTKRYQLAADGKPYGQPLTIFIDEYPTIAANCKGAAQAFKALAREGRKVDMRLVVLTQDANVKTLGVEGEGPVRESFSRLLLGSFAVKSLPIEAERQTFPAAFDYKGVVTAVSTVALPIYGKLRVNLVRVWGDLLEPTTEQPLSLSLSPADAPTIERKIADSTDSDSGDSATKLSERRIKAVQRAARAGMSRTLIIDLLGISPNKGYVLLDEILGPEKKDIPLQSNEPLTA